VKHDEKCGSEFTNYATVENQNPKTGNVYRMYADCRAQVSSQRALLVVGLESVVNDWKVLSKTELSKIDSKLDQANKALVTSQYYQSNRDYIQAKQYDEKYATLINEVVYGVHELREKKENLHPELILRTLQAELSFFRQSLASFEMCENAIRQLGPVDPIRFTGFQMECKNYQVASDGDVGTVNPTNPYAGFSRPGSSQPVQQQPVYVQQTVTYAQPLPTPVMQSQLPQLPPQILARGLYPFNGSDASQLSFNAGDTMVIISQEGAWWTAEFNGRRGFIPSNYVQQL